MKIIRLSNIVKIKANYLQRFAIDFLINVIKKIITINRENSIFFVNFIILGDVLTGDSNGNIFVWGRGYNAVTKVSIIRTITSKSREVNKLCTNK